MIFNYATPKFRPRPDFWVWLVAFLFVIPLLIMVALAIWEAVYSRSARDLVPGVIFATIGLVLIAIEVFSVFLNSRPAALTIAICCTFLVVPVVGNWVHYNWTKTETCVLAGALFYLVFISALHFRWRHILRDEER